MENKTTEELDFLDRIEKRVDNKIAFLNLFKDLIKTMKFLDMQNLLNEKEAEKHFEEIMTNYKISDEKYI